MTLEPDDIDRQFRRATLRTRQHWYEDGLAELLIGAVFVVLALYFAAQAYLQAGSGWPGGVFNLLLAALVVALALAGRVLIVRAKERYVYPRTGFVRYARRFPRWLGGLLAGGIAGLTAALFRTAPGLDAWIPALQGFVIGGFLFWQARFAGVARLYVLAMVSAIAGLVVSLLSLPSSQSGVAFFGAVGLAALATGWAAFHRFLRDVPPPGDR
ncbi:MAG TPA: hypothetical protein VK911_00715 [Vicinamibacterales bacterium]|nr:hypothetical protein [Vicinamibacterales bacterium]